MPFVPFDNGVNVALRLCVKAFRRLLNMVRIFEADSGVRPA